MSTLIDALIEASGDPTRVGARALDRHAAAHDASHFLLTPEVVVIARDAAEVGRLFAVSARHGVPLTLRSGGTSLSGQAVTDGILVDVRKEFRATQVLEDFGLKVTVVSHVVSTPPKSAPKTLTPYYGIIAASASLIGAIAWLIAH